MEKFLVVDIGTSSLRAAIVDGELNILRTEIQKRFAEECFDAEEEWGNIAGLVRRITRVERDISAIVVASLLGWVGVDEGLRAVTPCYSYMHNEREECARFKCAHTDEEVYPVCGLRITPEWGAFQLLHLKRALPQIYHSIKYYVSMKDFINMKLTGQAAVDHATAGYTMLYDIRKRIWSRTMADWTGIDIDKLPPLKEPYEILGTVSDVQADELGLERGIPVMVGSVDGTTGIFGTAVTESGVGVSVMGTTDVFYMITEEPVLDPACNLIVKPYIVPGKWLVGGPMGIFGGALDWLLHSMANDSVDISEAAEEAGKIPPGCGGLMVYPSLAGERAPFWNPAMMGNIVGIRHEHNLFHMCRAVMEANGYVTRAMLEAAERMGVECRNILVIGGGSKSKLWLQIKADITGKTYHTVSVQEATIIGSAMLGLLASGREPERLPGCRRAQDFAPEKEKHKIYDMNYDVYMRRRRELTRIYE